MSPVDWRELYASNRAVIEGRSGGSPTAPAPLPLPNLPATSPPLQLPNHDFPLPFNQLPGAARSQAGAGGDGTWEELALRDPAGRNAFVYTPPDLPRSTPAPLVVMLHGCTQNAASFAAATQMNAAADRHGFVVVYPEQSQRHNAQGCWNWFSAQHQERGSGEPAFVAAAVRMVLGTTTSWTIDSRRVYAAGLSAGGAMAAILAATHPDLFAAVAVHSGLAYGCATTLEGAFGAMARGGPDPVEQGQRARAAMGRFARPVPVMVIHGTADHTVAPVNGKQVVAQWLAANGAEGQAPSSRTIVPGMDGTRSYTRSVWADGSGEPLQEHLEVDGMGHAWSGGAVGGSFTDPRGPDATELIWDFFTRTPVLA